MTQNKYGFLMAGRIRLFRVRFAAEPLCSQNIGHEMRPAHRATPKAGSAAVALQHATDQYAQG